MDNIRIPVALQIVMDDMGWHEGANELSKGRPARTGINRNHAVEDYYVLNEIGKKIGMKILCGFTIGEWDKDNVLRGMKHATWDEENWDRASKIDMPLAEKCFKAIEESEFIEIAFHGLMHGYWIDGENYGNPREFYLYDLPEGATERRVDYPVLPVSADYVDEHLEAWFKIYNGWGFTKKVRSIISPASLYKTRDVVESYAERAKKYGIQFWKNLWAEHTCQTAVFDGIVFLNTLNEIVDWNCFDVDVDKVEDIKIWEGEDRPFGYAIMGCHWANFVRSNPEDNMKYVQKWAEYFIRQGERFGFMLSKDIAFAAGQSQFYTYTKMNFEENTLTLDVSEVNNQGAMVEFNEFYISVKNGLVPKSCDGATIEVYEKHKDFTNYKISDIKKDVITIKF